MRAMDDDATFFIDDQSRPWAFHRFDDHAAVALAAHLSDDRSWSEALGDEANQLVFRERQWNRWPCYPPPCQSLGR